MSAYRCPACVGRVRVEDRASGRAVCLRCGQHMCVPLRWLSPPWKRRRLDEGLRFAVLFLLFFGALLALFVRFVIRRL